MLQLVVRVQSSLQLMGIHKTTLGIGVAAAVKELESQI